MVWRFLNGLPQWPLSRAFTCFLHQHKDSTINNVLVSSPLISWIGELTISLSQVGVVVHNVYIAFAIDCRYTVQPPL